MGLSNRLSEIILPTTLALAGCGPVEDRGVYPSPSPISADRYEVLDAVNGQTELFQLEDIGEGRIFVLDFAGRDGGDRPMNQQARTFNRLRVFHEAPWAPRDRILSESDLEDRTAHFAEHFPQKYCFEGPANAHNYSATQLAEFFSQARSQKGVSLNDDEKWLLQLCLENQFFRLDGDQYVVLEPEKVILTVPEMQQDNPETGCLETITEDYRRLILGHELSHGLFTAEPNYREWVGEQWDSLTDKQRECVRTGLEGYFLGYDPHNDELMKNEMQAYLFHSSGSNPVAHCLSQVNDQLVEAYRTDLPHSFLNEDLNAYDQLGQTDVCMQVYSEKEESERQRVREERKRLREARREAKKGRR